MCETRLVCDIKWRLREKGQENGPKAEKDKTERVTLLTGLGRRTREEIYRKVGSN